MSVDLTEDIEPYKAPGIVSARNLHSDRVMAEVRKDIPGFLKKYFNFPNDEFEEPHHIFSPLMGREIGYVPHVVSAIDTMFQGGMYILQWFTDGAKSFSGTFFFPIMSLAEGPDEAHIICTDNFDDGKRRVQTLERELEGNVDLIRDFPWLKKPVRSRTGSTPTWSRREFTISGRSANKPNPSVYAASVTSGDVRQRRGKLILDDIEGREARARASVRKELYDFVKLEAIRCWEDRAESSRPLICDMGTPFDVDSIHIKLASENPDYQVVRIPAYTMPWDRVSGYAYMKKPGETVNTNTKTPWRERAALVPDHVLTWPRKRWKVFGQDPMFGRGMTKAQFFLAYMLDPTGGDPTRLNSDQMQKLMEEAEFQGEENWVTVASLDPAAGVGEDYCGISVVRIRWPKSDDLPEVQVLEAHRFEQGLFEQIDKVAELCWKYPEEDRPGSEKRPCRLIYENNAMQGGTYRNAFQHKHPEIRLVPLYTSAGAKFDTEMGLTVIRTLVQKHRLGAPESQIDSEGIQTLLGEVRDLGTEAHDHISASVWFVVRWLWRQVKAARQPVLEDPYARRRYAHSGNAFFRPHVNLAGTRWRSR